MFIVDINGNVRRGPYVRFRFKPKPSTANEWFRKGREFLDGNLLDDALRCFDEARRLGHERAEQAIEICKNHGAAIPPRARRRRAVRDISEFI